ncbi:2-octaprenyl-6-methoxyphenyl hydroxylase [Zavarzinia aquatilis]|uniref:2-octaprenyl-6-methoxyphenyl hydroxylase n=2 Tax=Zavarzinia aquatilis TaxID=2211142 RepID=A0A317E790_9PROT|nr:2-octaprenyl-6-methoxyphenyl hydroxylase [Zavarzinia aquatilis]
MPPAPDLFTDALVVGGGLVGLTSAIALAHAGLSVILVDDVAPEASLAPTFDGRATAIAHASCQLYRALGLYDGLAADGQPILDIRVSDGRPGEKPSPLSLHFHAADIGSDPFGLMVENRHARFVLNRAIAGLPAITTIAPARVTGTRRGGAGASATLADGRTIAARLIVACDGRLSPLRAEAGIRTIGWRYPQVGIVTTVEHERPHNGLAHEHFLPAGPFAILPLTGNRSSLVWTEASDLAPLLMRMDRADFDAELRRRFGDRFGAVHSVGPRFSYPLAFHVATRFADTRLALVGDAAHGLHPIAGQGLNLGLRDVAALAEVLADGIRIGLDAGDAELLARYERWRRLDSVIMGTVMDGLNRLFSTDLAPIRLARDLGLAAVERMPGLKRFFMHHARGTVGTLPRLLEGKPL